MSNVVSMGQPCSYLLARAAKHRRAGRYDEAMTLLSKAKDQFGLKEDIELETARVYEALGCDEEARRAYLRVFRFHGEHQASALYHLTVISAAQSDTDRAESYYQRLAAMKQKQVSRESIEALGSQLTGGIDEEDSSARAVRVRALEKRAVACLHAGKPAAAERDMRHVIRFHPSAERFTLLACCMMLLGRYAESIEYAQIAHELSPSRVQTICVLADACASAGRRKDARRWVYIASMRASAPDDLLAAAAECAKYGEDRLTLRLTKKLIKREPFHVRAMMLRACALVNLGQMKEASRLFARLSGLLPDDIVSETYFRMTKDGVRPKERLTLGLDLTHYESVELAKELLALLYADPDTIREDKALLAKICRQCHWAIRSPMANGQIKTVVLILMTALETEETQRVLLDALVDSMVPDSFKSGVLQVMTSKYGFKPYDVDFGGRLVRLAAGGVSSQPVRNTGMNQKIVQRVSDALAPGYPDAPGVLLPLYLAYADRYGTPKRKHEQVAAAALEYVYHMKRKTGVSMDMVAGRYGVPKRLLTMFIKRFSCMEKRPSQS